MTILPLLKKITKANDYFAVESKLKLSFDDEGALKCAETMFKDYFVKRGIVVELQKFDGNIKFDKIADNRTEFYKLEISDSGIWVGYTCRLSARNAVATLIAMLTKNGKSYVLPCCEIEDYADNQYRGFMLDIARQYIGIEEIKLRIRQLAHAKYNVMHMHMFDTERYALLSEAEPRLNIDPIFKQYTLDEMRDLVNYGNSFGITLIPGLDLPGHGLFLLDRLPELKCRQNGESIGIWDACVGNELLYELIEKLVKELVTVFDCEYIHFGGDELSFYDMKDSGYWPEWHRCDCCQTLAAENGYIDTSDLFCHFIRRVYTIVKSENKKLMIFNDAIDISRTVNLPRDILIHFWRVACETRGPNKGCSMERFLEEGFNVVNSFFEETYIDDYVNEQRLSKWTTTTSPAIGKETKGKVIGGEMCAWGIRAHFEYTLPVAFLMFGDRLWNNSPLNISSEIYSALTRQVIAKNKDFPNIFALLGSCIIPLNADDKFVKNEIASYESITQAIYDITRVIAEGASDYGVLMAYIRCLEDAKKAYPQLQIVEKLDLGA